MSVVALMCWLLAAFGVAALISRRRAWRQRFVSLGVLGAALVLALDHRPAGAVVLATAFAAVCAAEFARMVQLPRADSVVLLVAAVGIPVVAWADPARQVLPAVVAVAAVAPILAGDVTSGARRSAWVAFGVLWIGAACGALVTLGHTTLPLCVAVTAADVMAFAGGGLLPIRRLTTISPGKTLGGALTGAAAGIGVLAAVGSLTFSMAAAVTAGGLLGDLVESLVKRQAGVKDAGAWLPGFGGLLDRIDSILVAAPLALVLR